MTLHPIKDAILAETRRQFFGRMAKGIGGIALANLFAEDGFAMHRQDGILRRPSVPSALRPEGEALHLSSHGGRAAADGSARLQAGDEGLVRQGPAGIDPPGPAPHDDDLRAGALSHRALGLSSSRNTARAARGSPSCCPTPRRWSTTSPSSARCTPRRSITSPAITFIQTGHERRPALHRLVDRLRARQHEPGSADVRGAEREALPSQGERAGHLREAVERRLSLSGSTRASACAPAATRCSISTIPTA